VDQYLNNRRAELFYKLLANPADKDGEYAYNLQQLIADYPQSGLLQVLLSYSDDGRNLQTAAAYSSPKLLHKLNHDAAALLDVPDSQLIKQANGHAKPRVEGDLQVMDKHDPAYDEYTEAIIEKDSSDAEVYDEQNAADEPAAFDNYTEFEEPATEAEPFVGTEVVEESVEETPAQAEEPVTETEIPAEVEETLAEYEEPAFETEPYIQPETHTEINEPVTEEISDAGQWDTGTNEHTTEEIIEAPPEPEYFKPVDEEIGEVAPWEIDENEDEEQIVEPIIQSENKEPELEHSIDDEVYDEIVSIEDINARTEYHTKEEVTEAAAPEPETSAPKVTASVDEEKLILGNIVSTDFFVFDRAFGEQAPANGQQRAIGENSSHAEAHQDVSRYHDEKMPYSFMWWLDKTRQEHASVYQPYVSFKLDTTQNITNNVPDELQQQYYENIFHLTSVEDLEKSTEAKPVIEKPKKKEDTIIERFIQEVPQIKPQSGDKLDNENKAKKSAEDKDALVTETLASIYADQMLYPKAIGVYKKLMLKFPEKSRYFASQIEELEKKTI